MTVERQTMEVDIACVGFGPAMGGFLTTLSRALVDENGQALLESGVMPGMPLQVLCYERADDISFGVSGVVTRARSIRETFPDLDPAEIPMAAPVSDEKILYLLDPLGASRRSVGDAGPGPARRRPRRSRTTPANSPTSPRSCTRMTGWSSPSASSPSGSASQLMASGLVQVWPGMPVSAPLIEENRVVGHPARGPGGRTRTAPPPPVSCRGWTSAPP